MKLSNLYESTPGHWGVIKSHPGGLGGSGKTKEKEDLSFSTRPKQRKKYFNGIFKKSKDVMSEAVRSHIRHPAIAARWTAEWGDRDPDINKKLKRWVRLFGWEDLMKLFVKYEVPEYIIEMLKELKS